MVSGASGYIGGRLVSRLLDEGYRVRCIGRSARKLRERPWGHREGVEVIEADVEDRERVTEAMRGCRAAYYLVHSMVLAGKSYREKDRRLASSFAEAARDAGVARMVYLGGLGETGEQLSEHLSSRREVEERLESTGVPVTTLRAAMIIGSGSASFEILRYLVERLPVMITPRWVAVECQPIAVRNVLTYLVECLKAPETTGRALDIGGPEVMTYRDLMQEMASCLGLRRRVILPVPVLTPRLSAGWIHLVTPLSHRIARPLAEGLRNRVVVRDDTAAQVMPQRLLTVREAFEAALGRYRSADVSTKWSDAGPIPGDPDWAGGTVFEDRRQTRVEAPTDAVYQAFSRLGGDHGYYAADRLWRLRGVMDRLVGGPGLRRGRRHPTEVSYGEAVDFWRVTGVEEGRYLRLRAEMKLPGVATLEFEVVPDSGSGAHGSRVTQTARFKPKGLFGLLYWYAVAPLHGIVFEGMLRGIREAAEREGAASTERGGTGPEAARG
jgi:uncharacterized protein YbjT (DUF2867 family)